MRKTDALQGSLNLLVLKVLSRKPRLHGYVILAEIRVLSDGVLRVEEGSLYPALHRMKESGWLKARWTTNDNGRRTRQYELTKLGEKQLATEEERWQSVSAAVNQVLRRI